MTRQIIFFGSSAYSIPSLKTLLEANIPVTCVVTTKDKPAGRHLRLTPNPLKAFALEKHLPIIEKYSDLDIRENFVGLVAAFGRIIPQSVLDTFNNQIFNIHPSLLPKYRGPSPLQMQILDGVIETGVTVIKLDAQMDHGPIVAQETDTLLDTDTPETLGERLFIKGTQLFIKLLPSLGPREGSGVSYQDDSLATYTKKLTREDGFIPYEDYKKSLGFNADTTLLKRKFRAFYPWPGLWTTDDQQNRIIIKSVNPITTKVIPTN